MTDPESNLWRRCNTCKKSIDYKSLYWVCNVSTCNRKRTDLAFCTVSCWDAHVPLVNHRESWAEERHAPSREEWAAILVQQDEPVKRPRAKKVEEPAAPVTKTTAEPAKVIRRRTE